MFVYYYSLQFKTLVTIDNDESMTQYNVLRQDGKSLMGQAQGETSLAVPQLIGI